MAQPSILDYARFYGIAINHLASNPVDRIPVDGVEDIDASLKDPIDAPHLDLALAPSLINLDQEKLIVSRSVAVFLSSAIKPPAIPLDEFEKCWDRYLPDRNRVRNLMQEVPMLKSDHELDMRSFRSRMSLESLELDLPLEVINDENGEGLGFPSNFWEDSRQIQEKVKREKLDCSWGVLMYIQGIKNPSVDLIGELTQDLFERELCYTKGKELEPITPPLMPRDPTPVPFVPPSSSLELPILSEPDFPPICEHKELERKLLEETEILPGEALTPGGIIESPEDNLLQPAEVKAMILPQEPVEFDISLSPTKPQWSDLKIEVPITPPISAKKRQAEKEKKPLSELINLAFPEIPPAEELDNTSGKSLDGQLQEIALAAMQKLEGKLVNERIRGVDGTVRTQVPILKSPAITPPWGVGLCQTESSSSLGPSSTFRQLIGKMKDAHLSGSRCPMDPRDERSLEWKPFAVGAHRIDVNEKIEDTGVLQMFLEKPAATDLVEPETMPWTSTYLGRLGTRGDLDDDELSQNDFPAEKETRSLTAGDMLNSTDRDVQSYQAPHNSEKRKRQEQDTKSLMPPDLHVLGVKEDGTSQVLSGSRPSLLAPQFSTLNSLSNFMELRGHLSKKPKLDISPYFPRSTPVCEPDPATEHSAPNAQVDHPPAEPSTDTVDAVDLFQPFPNIPRPSGSLTFIISTALLNTHRSLIRDLESLSPPAILIFRDYTQMSLPTTGKHCQIVSEMLCSSVRATESMNLENDGSEEADIMISPASAVLLTTSQATTQLYLPGHEPKCHGLGEKINSPLRRRIFRICSRYEQLYVLVCHSTPTSPNQPGSCRPIMSMDQRTFESIHSLISFCSSLVEHATVTVLVIPLCPAEQLSRWIVSLASKHIVPVPWSDLRTSRSWSNYSEIPPEDPTVWELFLCQAGLNPFAANAILLHRFTSQEENCDTRCTPSPSSHSATAPQPEHDPRDALSVFVKMHPSQRKRTFGAQLGERVLDRVGRRLDVQRLSARAGN